MSVLLKLCFILVAVVWSLVPISEAQQLQRLGSVSTGDSFVKGDFSRKGALQGAITGIIDLILKNAKLLSEKNGLKIYRKTGGKEKAITDFQELQPYKTRGYRNNFWHFALAGDRKAMLRYENSEVSLSIWKYETLPNGERKRVMDKIVYGN